MQIPLLKSSSRGFLRQIQRSQFQSHAVKSTSTMRVLSSRNYTTYDFKSNKLNSFKTEAGSEEDSMSMPSMSAAASVASVSSSFRVSNALLHSEGGASASSYRNITVYGNTWGKNKSSRPQQKEQKVQRHYAYSKGKSMEMKMSPSASATASTSASVQYHNQQQSGNYHTLISRGMLNNNNSNNNNSSSNNNYYNKVNMNGNRNTNGNRNKKKSQSLMLEQERWITTDADMHFILTATGPDRVGIVSDITKIIVNHNGDVAESRMVRMGGDFTVMMRVTANRAKIDSITTKLYNLQTIHCLVHHVDAYDFKKEAEPVWEAAFTLQGANNPGIIHQVTDILKKYSIRIQDMHTDTELAPFGGTELFLLDGIIVCDKTFDSEHFEKDFQQLQDELGVDINIETLDRKTLDDHQHSLQA